MGTYITDRQHRLNNDIIQLFHLDDLALQEQEGLIGTDSHVQGGSSSSHQDQPAEGSDRRPQEPFHSPETLQLCHTLQTSVDAINLQSGTLPPLSKVLTELETVSDALRAAGYFDQDKKNKKGSTTQLQEHEQKLESLFLVKCTVAVYLHLLHKILNATLPLAKEIEYWQSLLDSRTWRSLYILQTCPIRVYNLTRKAVESTAEHLESLVRLDQRGSGGRGSVKTTTTITATTTTATSSDVNTGGIIRRRGVYFLQLLQFFPGFLNRHVLSSPVTFPVAVHYEISGKRKMLNRLKEYQAECLGLLAEQGLNLDPLNLGISEHSLATHQGVTSFVQDQMSASIGLMQQVLEKAVKDAQVVDKRVSARKLSRSLTRLGAMTGIADLSSQETFAQLSDLIQTHIPHYIETTSQQARQFDRPSWVTRIWIPTLISYFGIKYSVQYLTQHREDVDAWIQEAFETAKNFLTDWVWEPSKKIMEIIQHKDDNGSLQMLGNESLKSDIDSLERMVLTFAKDQYGLTLSEMDHLSKAVHNGDISLIMKAYEQEMTNPLKSALTGHLIQTLLIQVQKTKVDIEVAMAALDKLLKANELNFAFLAVGPSLLLLWAATSQTRSVWNRLAGRSQGLVAIHMRDSLRQVEKLLNLATAENGSVPTSSGITVTSYGLGQAAAAPSLEVLTEGSLSQNTSSSSLVDVGRVVATESATTTTTTTSVATPLTASSVVASRFKQGKVSYKTQGLILCEVHLLRIRAQHLSRSNGLQDKVLEDLREIEESNLTVHQRLRTTKRMYRTYGFLGLHS